MTAFRSSQCAGYVRTNAVIVDDEQIEALLAAYRERAENDRTRLDYMMRYAELLSAVRMSFANTSNEPAGEPCRNCDNCVNHTAEQHAAAALHAACAV